MRGVVFQLLDAEKQVKELALETNDQGEITLDRLAPGTYYFREWIAPNGYQRQTVDYPVVVPEQASGQPKQVTVTVVNQPIRPNTPVTPGTKTPPGTPSRNRPENSNGKDLASFLKRYPQLSEPFTLWGSLAGLLVLIGAGIIYRKRKKKQ